jgi:hypothetical protein
MPDKTYTHVTESGRQVEVSKKEWEALNPQAAFADRPEVDSPGESEVNLLHNDAYVAAHGPAEPIRGRQMFPEQTHPGIAVNAALGIPPDTFVVPAPGRTVQAELPDPTQNITPSQLRDELEAIDSPILDEADDKPVDSPDVSSPEAQNENTNTGGENTNTGGENTPPSSKDTPDTKNSAKK